MAYLTGTINNYQALVDALVIGCTDNGYTYKHNVLYKGDLAVEVKIFATGALTGVSLTSAVVDSGGEITRKSHVSSWLGDFSTVGNAGLPAAGRPSFPCNYRLHINTDPDEVYFLINYQNTVWQWLCFGQNAFKMPNRSGNWTASNNGCATGSTVLRYTGGSNINQFGLNEENASSSLSSGLPFINQAVGQDSSSYYQNSKVIIDNSLESDKWMNSFQMLSIQFVRLSLPYQPNVWNGDSILFPIKGLEKRTEGMFSYVLTLSHVRSLRNTNYEDEQIITLGSDEWVVYPAFIKNATEPSSGSNHSGTIGFAVKKQG